MTMLSMLIELVAGYCSFRQALPRRFYSGNFLGVAQGLCLHKSCSAALRCGCAFGDSIDWQRTKRRHHKENAENTDEGDGAPEG